MDRRCGEEPSSSVSPSRRPWVRRWTRQNGGRRSQSRRCPCYTGIGDSTSAHRRVGRSRHAESISEVLLRRRAGEAGAASSIPHSRSICSASNPSVSQSRSPRPAHQPNNLTRFCPRTTTPITTRKTAKPRLRRFCGTCAPMCPPTKLPTMPMPEKTSTRSQ